MKFNRTINVNGTSVVDGADVNINFSYTAGIAPLSVYFNVTKETAVVNGEVNAAGVVNYNVSQGIVTDEFMKLVETECKRVLTNYETV